MDTQKFHSLSMIKTHFLEEILHRTMLRIANSIWVLACNIFFSLFGLIFRYIFRLGSGEITQKNNWNYKADDHPIQDDRIASVCETEEENHDFVFRFQRSETEDSVFRENSLNHNTSKYQVFSTKTFMGFMEEPENLSFTIEEAFVGQNDSPIGDNGNQDFEELDLKAEESVFLGKSEDSVESSKDFLDKLEEDISTEFDPHGNKEMEDNLSDEVRFLSENEFWCLDSKPNSTEGFSISSQNLDSVKNDFFPDSFVDEESDNPSDNPKLEFSEKITNSEEIGRNKAEDTDDEYTEFEPNFHCLDKSEEENLPRTEEEGKSEEVNTKKKSWDLDSEEDDEFDILLKHQELIEQMKVEMKNATRSKGLPTILEESESPKMVEDLKPLRIDEKWEHKDRLDEIQKVYKGYAEKMRKLDVLNYQTLHAISFLQLKDPNHHASGQKYSASAIKSLLFPNLWTSKLRRIYADPTLRSITDLHRNLELVYVGQICLSWEILHWQYGKGKELLETDIDICEENCSYNQVAGEFQQFQVLVQRFVENEAFQGPRVQNYAKNRCDLRTFLQVPAIKDDYLKDKKDSRVEGEIVVSMAMLTQIIDKSMRVFWEFLHADKEEANVILKGIQSTHVDLQDPSDSGLLMEIKTSLQKKEKRLKDIVRSGNCIVKKFQKHQEGGRLEGTLLLAQVELKLVSRVLNMSRLTTDQLVWCQKKLNKINFFGRKVQVEPSFLLFPF